jgi:GTPase SAR1 family protein
MPDGSLDTAGVEQFIAMRLDYPGRADSRDHQMRDRHGFILVYDITNPSSMDDLNDLYVQIQQNKSPAALSSIRDDAGDPPDAVIPLVLVGNKLDLASERKVSHQRGKTRSKQWNCSHYETSAKTRTNVDEVFYDLVGQIMALNEEAVKSRKASTAMSPAPGEAGEKDGGDDFVGTTCCVVS